MTAPGSEASATAAMRARMRHAGGRGLLAAGAVLALGGTAVADDRGSVGGHAVESGAAAVLELLPPEVLEGQGVAPEDLAAAVLEVASVHAWQPIDSAPRDQQILLGLRTEAGFQVALGRWDVVDEPVLEEFTGGEWSTASWWGTDPTHWAAIPAPPEAE